MSYPTRSCESNRFLALTLARNQNETSCLGLLCLPIQCDRLCTYEGAPYAATRTLCLPLTMAQNSQQGTPSVIRYSRPSQSYLSDSRRLARALREVTIHTRVCHCPGITNCFRPPSQYFSTQLFISFLTETLRTHLQFRHYSSPRCSRVPQNLD